MVSMEFLINNNQLILFGLSILLFGSIIILNIVYFKGFKILLKIDNILLLISFLGIIIGYINVGEENALETFYSGFLLLMYISISNYLHFYINLDIEMLKDSMEKLGQAIIHSQKNKEITQLGISGVTCHCGEIIPDDNINKWNGCNEEGEDYGVVTANCDICGAEYETTQWGEWDNLEDAKSYLQDYINGNK